MKILVNYLIKGNMTGGNVYWVHFANYKCLKTHACYEFWL